MQLQFGLSQACLYKTNSRKPRGRAQYPTPGQFDLPKQQEELVEANTLLDCLVDHPPLQGEGVAVDAVEGDIGELTVGMDVCIYTDIKSARPWVGVVTEVLDKREFRVNWYQRKGRSRKFYPMKDGSSSLIISKQSLDSVMFWGMSQELSDVCLELSPYWMKKIANEYSVLDQSVN